MKYKRGSIVEVLVTDEFHYHSWRCAQVVSGNGHNYSVSYDVYPGFTDQADVERVSVKSIRPCPPLVEMSECWVHGDVVEVFNNLSWKMAIVLKALDWDQFLVRLVGSCEEFEVIKSELRVRQSWQNGEWIVIGKVPRDYEDGNHINHLKCNQDSGSQSKRRDAKMNFYIKDLCSGTQNNKKLMESRTISSKKRGSPYEPSRVLKLKLNDTNSVTSSTGSCGIDDSYKPNEIYYQSGHDSDAESVCQLGYREGTERSSSKEALADEIHKLELHAYRCTMEALHASGPLNWEKETMVTNLRMSLHISNDEHLIQLKNLISSTSSIGNR